MRCSPFFIALSLGLTAAALTFGELSPAMAQEAAVGEAASQATDAANDTADAATDAANDSADAATNAASNAADATNDAANDATDAASDAANNAVDSAANTTATDQAADATNNAAQQAANAAGSAAQSTTGAANRAANAAQTQLDAQGRPLAGANRGAQGQLSTGLNADANLNQRQIDAQQSGQIGANSQLSAQAIDQRLGLQFDQAVGAAAQGLTISTIQPNSVFYNSGLRQGDVVMSVDNRPFTNRAEFARLITTYQQDRIPLIVMRNGQRQTIYFSRPADFVVRQQPSQAMLGVTFDTSKGGAAVVRAVTPDSPAEQIGIMAGDVITGLDGKPILAAHEVISAIGAMQPGQQVTVDYSRNEQKLRAETVLAARAQLERHTVGYAPAASAPAVPAPSVDQPVLREDTTYRAQPTSPGDPDGDGLRLDGDGRIPRRVLNRR